MTVPARYMLLDSTYRDYRTNPVSTSFTLQVNAPTRTAKWNSSSIQNYVYYRFRWVGQSTTIIPNDTLTGNCQPYSSNIFILETMDIPPEYACFTKMEGYFIGMLFVFTATGESSIIIDYNVRYKRVILQMDLSNSIMSNVYDYKIINPSGSYGNNILCIGTLAFSYNDTTRQELASYLLVRDLSLTMSIQNITQNWILPIQAFVGYFRQALLSPSHFVYEANDLLQIRLDETLFTYTITSSFQTDAVYQLLLIDPGRGYKVGDIVQLQNNGLPCRLLITKILNGQILEWKLLDPGSGFTLGQYHDTTHFNHPAIFQISSVYPAFFIGPLTLQVSEYIVYFPKLRQPDEPQITYFVVRDFIDGWMYIWQSRSFPFFPADQDILGTTLEFIPIFSQYQSLNVPLITDQQAVCYEMQILALLLPNRTVKGTNIQLAFFPYVLVEISNISSSNSRNKGLLISNNPHANTAVFVCPIANLKNPDIIRYIGVSSPQMVTMKFNPTDDLYIRITFPNGNLVEYNSPTLTEMPIEVWIGDSLEIISKSSFRNIVALSLQFQKCERKNLF